MRKRPRGFLAIFAALALTAGCGRGEQDSHTVVVIGEGKPAIVDPAGGALTQPQQVMIGAAAQGLVRFDARGQIEPGLAERWTVSDDGLSYIFRLKIGEWPDGRSIRARDVARQLNRTLRGASRSPLRDSLGAVEEVVAMTERVIEIRLLAPRPNLLQLLAQPEMGIVRERMGTGPFVPGPPEESRPGVPLTYVETVMDAPDRRERIDLDAAAAPAAIAAFTAGKADLVLGGTFDDLPLARRAGVAGRDLRFDPVAGLFGLVPARQRGPAADKDLRALLHEAIDRAAVMRVLEVPGLVSRATLLQGGLDGLAAPTAPEWSIPPIADRRADLVRRARVMTGTAEPTRIAVSLPDGPGGQMLFNRLKEDWGALGLEVVRADAQNPADFRLVDMVAPSTSPAWFVRHFRCEVAKACVPQADALMDSARQATVAAQRAAFIAEAARLLDEETVFIPLSAPVRWSLVSRRVEGFAENVFARHALTGLGRKPNREGR